MRDATKYDWIGKEFIPAARELLMELADELRVDGQTHAADEIHAIVHGLMFRDAGKRKNAPVFSDKITPQKIRDVKAFALANGDLGMEHIGRACGVSGGRVSEILNGKRTEEDPTASRLKTKE